MSKIKCVVFDLDGVLVDATEWHYEALNRALTLFGFSISRYEHLSSYNGLPTRKKLEMLTVEKGLPAGLHALINNLKQVHTREEILVKCRPIFEKEYMINRLRREGYRIAVCSNSIRETVELMLRQSGLYGYCDFTMGNEDVQHAKPDPEMYLAATTRFGCRPDEVAAVEDAPHGVASAKRAGLPVCEVKGFAEVDYERIRQFIGTIEGTA